MESLNSPLETVENFLYQWQGYEKSGSVPVILKKNLIRNNEVFVT